MINPVVLHSEPAMPSEHNVLRRAINAILIERRIPYRLERPIDRICKAAGLRHKRVKVGGFTLTVRRLTQDEQFVQNVLLGDDYVREGFEIDASDTVIDIGGNIGSFSLRAARLAVNGRVFCYEPQPENFSLLQKNVSRNRIRNIAAFPVAVGGQAGTVRLFEGGDTGLHSMSAARAADGSIYQDVPCVTLEQVFEENQIGKCNFLKIDCEGAEYEILYNTPRNVLARVDKIVMEYHSSAPDEKRSLSDGLVEFLQGRGFHIVDYIDFADFDCGFIRAKRNH